MEIDEKAKNVMNGDKVNARNTKDAIFFNFSYAALKLLGKNLYSNPCNAISELVANAIDAKAREIYVYIDMTEKASSTIEIIDNGKGMDYSDLAEKYVWIGRNKRNDGDVTKEEKQSIMGRKGIGKLAALYLSNQYYILSKREEKETDNKWKIDLSGYTDSDFPRMDRVKEPIPLANSNIWKSVSHGTVIRIEKVDLRGNGETKIESLRRVLADFYLVDDISSKIYVCVKMHSSEDIGFKLVEKRIAYKNFYALFDNSGKNVTGKMLDEICFTWASKYDDIRNKKRNTVVLDEKKFITNSVGTFHKEDGTLIEKEYKLIGWIAIHSTIEQKNAVDENFLRNNIYQPNRLRIYVRNKIALEDYFVIRPNTQAMSNYIEGELSFDILDDDDLPDIATSSRQDFLGDERVNLLVSIVDPIVSALIGCRNKIGHTIAQENEAYETELRRKEEERRKEAEAAQLEAEKKQEETAKKYVEAREEVKKLHQQNNTLFSSISEDQASFSSKTHLIKTNALTIRNSVTTLAGKIGIGKYKELGAISVATDKMLSSLKYCAIAKFNIEDENIQEDLFIFCKEYLINVLSRQYYNIHFVTEIEGECFFGFNPQYFTLVLDNLVANSEKSNSTECVLWMKKNGHDVEIQFCDNGEGFGNNDMQKIFEFGYSNTGGSGIGLYNIKNVVEKMDGSVIAERNMPKGARFIIHLKR